jgi:hypothetical protein
VHAPAVLQLDAVDALAVDEQAPHARPRVHGAAGAADGLGQHRDEAAGIDRVVARHVEREPHGRRERRLGAPRGRRQQPLDTEPEPPAERQQPVELLGLVAVAGDDDRARLAQPRIAAGRRGELGAERGECGGGAEAQVEQRVLAELRFGDRRQHPGGDMPGAGLAGVEHAHAQAALGGTPRAREPDRPAADDRDVRLGILHDHCS